MPDSETNLLRGTLVLLILRALSWGSLHGYAIAEWIETATDESLLVEEGTLYPALHRLERQGLIASSWGVSDNKRKAKYYRLTARGRSALRDELAAWEKHTRALTRALSVRGATA